MALGVRACLQSVEVYLVLIGFDVSLESIQIQNQGRRRQFAQTARLSYESRVRAGKTLRNIYFLHLIIVLQTQQKAASELPVRRRFIWAA
jgi:hypothetical protein